MKAEQVDAALKQKFIADDERVVFWHDASVEFESYVTAGLPDELSEVHVLDMAETGGLSAKLRLEREDRTGKYLVYSTGESPPPTEDWLLDIRLYSAEFHADIASLWLEELDLTRLSLRDHLKARSAFMRSKERRKKLSRLITEDDGPAELDLKMMAVLAGSEVASPFEVLRALCHGHEEDGDFDLTKPPEALERFAKMGLLEEFWKLMRSKFSYPTDDEPSIAGLLRALFVSELFKQTGGPPMDSLAHLRLPGRAEANSVVFLTQWRDSSGTARSYDAAAAAVAAEQRVSEPLADYELETIKDVYTFWEAEKRVVSKLKDRLLEDRYAVDVDELATIAGQRKAGHWLSGPGSDTPDRRAVAQAYDAIVAAAELFALLGQHRNNLRFETPAELVAAYLKSLHKFERRYRQFCTNAGPALDRGWDLLKSVADEIERAYGQGFLRALGIEWSRLLDEGFLEEWSLPELKAQREFYDSYIVPHLAESERKRAFVIISDAFRYEAAGELVQRLKGEFRMDAELSTMLGVLPSYTALGMAALLPHESLSYDEQGRVLADGNLTAGTEARGKQLASVDGMACRAKDLLVLKTEEAREFTGGSRVVYVYHNVIDARGDSSLTEHETFEAVSDCIDELVELVQFCVTKLGAGKVWVTADHGFLFQQSPPSETARSKIASRPESALQVKSRYVIGRSLGPTPEGHHGRLEVTARATGGMEFWVPRAANRFHFGGGARFAHGGAMPQEVLVPVVTVKRLRGRKKEASRVEKVSVQVLGSKHKITTPTHRFEVIQTEAVGPRREPLTVRAAVYEGTEPVTSVQTVTFDSTSDSIDERKKSIRLELGSRDFDKETPYRLVLRDVDTEAEVQSVPVVIDRSFDDDF